MRSLLGQIPKSKRQREYDRITMALGRTSTAQYHCTISVNERCRNFGKSLSGTQRIAQGKDFEVILTVKWKLDIPLRDGYIVSIWP